MPRKKPMDCSFYAIRRSSIQKISQEGIEAIEREKHEPFYSDYVKYSPEYVLRLFEENPEGYIKWSLIPAEQYENILKRYMDDPISARVPDSIVSSWLSMIFSNTCKMISITRLFGRAFDFPIDAVSSVFPDFKCDDGNEIRCAMNFLDGLGFYRWTNPPECGRLWTDVGVVKLYEALKTYREDMTPEEKLLLINRVLDIAHWSETLARYFLEGGELTCEKISGQRRGRRNDDLIREFNIFG